MAKKELKGIASLLTNTEKKEEKNISNVDETALFVRIPKSLNKEINLYCAKEGISKKDFITDVLEKALRATV